MGVFNFITEAFIDFFGITQPDVNSRRRATVYISGLLALVVLVFVAFFVFIRFHSR